MEITPKLLPTIISTLVCRSTTPRVGSTGSPQYCFTCAFKRIHDDLLKSLHDPGMHTHGLGYKRASSRTRAGSHGRTFSILGIRAGQLKVFKIPAWAFDRLDGRSALRTQTAFVRLQHHHHMIVPLRRAGERRGEGRGRSGCSGFAGSTAPSVDGTHTA